MDYYDRVFSITDFAKYARTSRDTLLFYDKNGLLPPVRRGKNNYRYYSNAQLAIYNLIRTYQTMGMSLAEINKIKRDRTPELIADVLNRQIELVDEKIGEWTRTRKLLFMLQKTICDALYIDEKQITVQFMPAEAIVLGEQNDYSEGKNTNDAILSFYNDCSEKYPGMDLNYPLWATFSEERLKRRDWVWPDRFYLMNPDGLDKKPAGLYAIGYTRGGYGKSADLYRRLYDYIDTNELEICGPSFEEHLLNEICVSEPNDYLMRIQITVRKKTT